MSKEKEEVDKDFDLEKEDVYCYDCAAKDVKTKIKIKNGEILNGAQLFFDTKNGKICIFKCDECFEKFKGLKDYQECEVYARIVGYIRPVKQWHTGKVSEFEDRVNFNIQENE